MATINISLPNTLSRKIDLLREHKGYATRSELIRELLRERLAQEPGFEIFKKPSLELIKEDLKHTGRYNAQFIKSVINGLKKSSLYADKHKSA